MFGNFGLGPRHRMEKRCAGRMYGQCRRSFVISEWVSDVRRPKRYLEITVVRMSVLGVRSSKENVPWMFGSG